MDIQFLEQYSNCRKHLKRLLVRFNLCMFLEELREGPMKEAFHAAPLCCYKMPMIYKSLGLRLTDNIASSVLAFFPVVLPCIHSPGPCSLPNTAPGLHSTYPTHVY